MHILIVPSSLHIETWVKTSLLLLNCVWEMGVWYLTQETISSLYYIILHQHLLIIYLFMTHTQLRVIAYTCPI